MLSTRVTIVVVRCDCARREQPSPDGDKAKTLVDSDVPETIDRDPPSLRNPHDPSSQPEGPVSVIRSALGRLDGSRDHLDAVYSELHSSTSDLSLVDQGFRDAQFSIDEAVLDDRETDVTDYGLAIKGQFRRVGDYLRDARNHLGEVEAQNLGFHQDLESISESLREIRDQIDVPEARRQVDIALRDLEEADEHYVETSLEQFQADRQSRYLQGEVNYNLFVENLIADRPGTDVSLEARQLQNKVGSYLSWNLAKANSAIQGALGSNGQARKESHEAEEALRKALESLGVELPPPADQPRQLTADQPRADEPPELTPAPVEATVEPAPPEPAEVSAPTESTPAEPS